MNLRPYQLEAIKGVEAGWDDPASAGPSRQLGVAPTGAGKTIMFAKLAALMAARGRRTLILAHREELIEQARAKIRAATGINAEIEKAEQYASHSAPVVVASVQTLMRDARQRRWAQDHFGFVVCDEAHHSISDSWQAVLKRFHAHAHVVGVTATPDRGDKRTLANYYSRLAFEIRLVDLIRDGYLSPITVRAVPLEISLDGVRSVAGDLDAEQLGHSLEPYLAEIAASVRKYASGRRVLAFLPLIATSKKFVEACRAEGLRSEHVDGYDFDRGSKLTAFEGFDYDVLSNAMLLTEGYDDPGIDCVLVLRPTKSRALYAQMIGRGTRTHPLKSELLILDFLWAHTQHSLSRPANLVASSEAEADVMTKVSRESGGEKQLDLLELQGTATEQREQTLRKRLAEQAGKSGKFISADEWAANHERIGIADYEPTFDWEKKPVSEKQARVLKRAGIDISTVRGAGHASQIIGVVLGDIASKTCSESQKVLLRRLGHESPETATVGEFRKWMGRIKGAAA